MSKKFASAFVVCALTFAGTSLVAQSRSAKASSTSNAFAGSMPLPQAFAGSMPLPQAFAGSMPLPQAFAGSMPLPQAFAGSMPLPQVDVVVDDPSEDDDTWIWLMLSDMGIY